MFWVLSVVCVLVKINKQTKTSTQTNKQTSWGIVALDPCRVDISFTDLVSE